MIRQKGYLWLTAVLATALLIVVLIGSLPDSPTAIPEEASPLLSTRPTTTAPHHTNRWSSHHYHKSNVKYDAHQPSTSETPGTSYPSRKKEPLMFDLNDADSTDLVQLYNIGPTFARRIIRYRTLLGGYVDKGQLMEVYGMDSARFNDITPHLYITPNSVATLDLNSASIDQLKRHPYLDYYQAKAIVRLRETSGPYDDIHEILEIPIIDQQTFTHIEPYLTCSSQPNK